MMRNPDVDPSHRAIVDTRQVSHVIAQLQLRMNALRHVGRGHRISQLSAQLRDVARILGPDLSNRDLRLGAPRIHSYNTAQNSTCTNIFPGSSWPVNVCRAGRDASSGNIFSHSWLRTFRCAPSFSHTVSLRMSSVVPDAASMIRRRCRNTSAHCSSIPSGTLPVFGSLPAITLLTTNGPILLADGIGASWWNPSISMLCRFMVCAPQRHFAARPESHPA